ncbi:DNA repair protein RecO [Leptolyngbya sp. NIES-2104]|uniref:DNA repair protein RecO n=1 Tax=Leptolyngbya sp. NIES-2104 TaxID=1552121 RepID=UPI0006ECA189|nr:DNA repair protein RecO [Leptolyngbya sp. NIES-2104]GAP93760.1 DNA recombination and repair protein RecO [Leptolyngbya sp. NIES-2104]
MSRTYKAIGINLKAMPLGEADRIVTILTKEFGLLRAVAMGARKQNSKLGGRSGLFVVNELLMAKGRSLDKITQAETLESYPGLARNLKKLTAGQYLAELTLQQALSEQPQEELFYLLNEHLGRIEQCDDAEVLPRLIHAVYQLLVVAGIAPQVHQCSVTGAVIQPDFENPDVQAGFSSAIGGVVKLEELDRMVEEQSPAYRVQSPVGEYRVANVQTVRKSRPALNVPLHAPELAALQHLPQAEPPTPDQHPISVWLTLEKLLRQYAQYHFDQPIRSAALIESCFAPDSML